MNAGAARGAAARDLLARAAAAEAGAERRGLLAEAVARADGRATLRRVAAAALELGAPAAALGAAERLAHDFGCDLEDLDRVTRAVALLRLGRLDEAETVLRPVAASGTEDAQRAATLQLANLARLRRTPGAADAFEAVAGAAARAGDLAVAVAAWCGLGELALEGGDGRGATLRFGRALGLTEAARAEALTVAPLAGLAEAHALWHPERPRGKALGLARRAVERARVARDPAAEARARSALGSVLEDAGEIRRALGLALDAHRPLAVLIGARLLALEPAAVERARVLELAGSSGLSGRLPARRPPAGTPP